MGRRRRSVRRSLNNNRRQAPFFRASASDDLRARNRRLTCGGSALAGWLTAYRCDKSAPLSGRRASLLNARERARVLVNNLKNRRAFRVELDADNTANYG